MARRLNSISQFYLSPVLRVVAEQASPMALAEFRQQVLHHNIPYWGPACVVRLLDLVDGELLDALIGTLLTLPVLPFRVSYPVLTSSQLTLEGIYCPQINYPGNNFPPYKFHLAPAADSHPSSNAKLSSSSSGAESQSSCRS
jgi:hypothetical protein